MANQNTVIVIFGASGDLTSRKLLPALYNNYCKERLPANTKIIGTSRSLFSDDEFRDKMKQGVQKFSPDTFAEKRWSVFSQDVHYQPGNINEIGTYQDLDKRIKSFFPQSESRLYYLSTAPQFYPIVISMLGETGMVREVTGTDYRRVIIEKPFGRDLQSAIELNQCVHKVFDESQVYRIDHYLGKETVQNILVFRFSNTIFEPIWNRNYIDHVQITVAEKVGVGHRAEYYDQAGVLRDMFQNHLLQLLTLIAMEPPVVNRADPLRNEKVKVLNAIQPLGEEQIRNNTVRAQYEGYSKEKGVAEGSQTPTYAALELHVNNWRWQGVPFYLRSGKHLSEKVSEITVHFRETPHQLFELENTVCQPFTNRLSLCIQPDEGMHLRISSKVPDKGMEMQAVDLEFHYNKSFKDTVIPEAYERLLIDALHADPSLFARSDEIELAWRLIDGINQSWSQPYAPPIATYQPGSWGPAEANHLLIRNGRCWFHSCGMHEE